PGRRGCGRPCGVGSFRDQPSEPGAAARPLRGPRGESGVRRERSRGHPGPVSFARTPTTRVPLPRRVAAAVRFAGVRTLFSTLDRVAPQRAADRAFDLWCTLPHNAGRRKDHRSGPGEVTRLPLEHGDVVVETWGDVDRPVVYLVHGWGGWRGQMGAFVEPLLAT